MNVTQNASVHKAHKYHGIWIQQVRKNKIKRLKMWLNFMNSENSSGFLVNECQPILVCNARLYITVSHLKAPRYSTGKYLAARYSTVYVTRMKSAAEILHVK